LLGELQGVDSASFWGLGGSGGTTERCGVVSCGRWGEQRRMVESSVAENRGGRRGGFISAGDWGGLEEEAGPSAHGTHRGAASPAALQAVAHGDLTPARRAAGERDATGGSGRNYSVFCFFYF
jgi:hypothetical protein